MDENNFPNAQQVYGSVAKEYANFRPGYPPQLFSFLSSLTPQHDLAWDVGTGNGQAALQISEYYKRVIATDTSDKQLQHAFQRPNITYALTPPVITDQLIHSIVGPDSSVDLATVASAVHHFDLDKFYPQVKRVLKKPGGVIAVWSYTNLTVDPAVDAVYERFVERTRPFQPPLAKLAFEAYENLPFPFAEVESMKMEIEEERTFDQYLGLLKTSASVVGREGLVSEFSEQFEAAWGAPDHVARTVKFPLVLNIGKV